MRLLCPGFCAPDEPCDFSHLLRSVTMYALRQRRCFEQSLGPGSKSKVCLLMVFSPESASYLYLAVQGHG